LFLRLSNCASVGEKKKNFDSARYYFDDLLQGILGPYIFNITVLLNVKIKDEKRKMRQDGISSP
jgi:hypothetical protein